jgi:hypothetical protein
MATKTSKIFAGAAVGAFFGLAAAIALTPGPADAGYGVEQTAPKTVSNIAAKGDMAEVTKKAPKAVEVAEIRKIGNDFIIRDSRGRTVYRSDVSTHTTTIEKNAAVPLLTGYGVAVGRVDAAFQATSN